MFVLFFLKKETGKNTKTPISVVIRWFNSAIAHQIVVSSSSSGLGCVVKNSLFIIILSYFL